MSDRRVIIIGSGLGGLSCGLLLSRAGYDVTVLEQQARLGGCLQTFRRDGATFETGIHFIGSADEGQILHTLFERLGLASHIRLSRLDPAGYDRISLSGVGDFRLANGHEAFVDTLAADFPREREALERYVALTGSIAMASSLDSLTTGNSALDMRARYATRSMDSVIEELFTDPTLRQVITGTLPLIAARRGATPFTLHAFIMEFYNRSAFRIVGGSEAIARTLADGIRANGGRLLTGHRAVEILTDSDGVRGVRIADGTSFEARHVISDAPPAVTLSLLPGSALRPAFRHRIGTLPQTAACFTLYLKFRPGQVPYMNYNEYCYEGCSPWDCEDYTAADWPRGYLYMHTCHEAAPGYAKSGVVISYLRPEETERWRGTKPGRRGEDYEAMKRERAERLLDVMERKHPGLRAHIESYYTSTPLTYEDYTSTLGGAMYGIAPDIRLGAAGRVPIRWRPAGLLQTGQCVNSHGILGTLIGTLLTLEEMERK